MSQETLDLTKLSVNVWVVARSVYSDDSFTVPLGFEFVQFRKLNTEDVADELWLVPHNSYIPIRITDNHKKYCLSDVFIILRKKPPMYLTDGKLCIVSRQDYVWCEDTNTMRQVTSTHDPLYNLARLVYTLVENT